MPRKTTRNAQGGGTIRQRKDGTWEGRYTVGRDPGTGKQIQKSVYGKTQKEVRQRLQQITTAIDDGTYTKPSNLTVGQWLDLWHRDYLGGVKQATVAHYGSHIETHLKPALGAIRLTDLRPHQIQALYNRLLRSNENPDGLSAKSIKNLHGVLHRAFNRRFLPVPLRSYRTRA